MKIDQAQLYGYTLALRNTLPLRDKVVSNRVGFLLRLRTDSGLEGWGDAAPLPGFCLESPQKTLSILKHCAERLHGYRLPKQYRDLEGAELVNTHNSNCAAFAVESAYFNLAAQAQELPLYRYLSETAPPIVPLNALLAGEEKAILTKAETLNSLGYHRAKLKVGNRRPEEEVALVDAIFQKTGPDFQLRLDANRAWPLQTALKVSGDLADYPIEYIEEPLSLPPQLPHFAQESPIPYAIDETFHNFPERARRILAQQPIDSPTFKDFIEELTEIFSNAVACIWKPSLIYAPNMGHALHTNTLALPVQQAIISAAFESGIGIATLANFASAFCGTGVAVGLDTYDWLAEDVLTDRLPMEQGVVDLDALNSAAASVDYTRLNLLFDSKKKSS